MPGGLTPPRVPRDTCRAWVVSEVDMSRGLTPVGSADPVGTGEARREQAHQQRRREADDVQVVALDSLDERGAATLDRVRARAVSPLAGAEIGADVARAERAERHPRDGVLDDLDAIS